MNPAEYLRSISPGVVRQKFRLSRNDSGVWGDGFDDEGTIILRSTEVSADGDWQIEAPAIRSLTPAERHRGLVQTGDLIITTSSGSRRHIGKTALVDDPVAALGCAFANFMQRLRVRKGQEPRFYRYLLNAPVGREQMFYLGSTTTGLMNLNGTVLGNIEVPDAPPETQRAIAAFLDRKTAAIDDLIDKKERLIKLLAEKRAALIHRAVTKGLDDGVPMKDSGVEWIGEIPAHWEVKRLKHLTRQVTVGIVITPSKYYCEVGVPALRSLNVNEGALSQRDLVFITNDAHAMLSKSRLSAGDLVAVRTGQPGTTAVVDDHFDGANCIDLIIIRRPSGRMPHLLAMALNSTATKAQYGAGSTGAIQQHFNVETAKNLLLAVPPRDHEPALLAHIEAGVADIDGTVALSQEQIDKLREYRQALITAAVTGQIDIPAEDAA